MSLKPYQGTEPFIFISYSDNDFSMVEPILYKLNDSGCKFWYRSGIHLYEKWNDAIAERLEQSALMIALVSSSYISNNYMDELNYAKDTGKKILIIYLENFVIPQRIRLLMNRIPSIMRFRFVRDGKFNENDFYERLFEMDDLKSCLENNVSPYDGFDCIPLGQPSGSSTFSGNNFSGSSFRTISIDGGIYEGQFKNGMRCGYGKFTGENGYFYEGNYNNDLPDGKGREETGDGSVYEGDFVNGKKTGKGRYIFGEGNWKGDKYEGDFLDGKFHGKGKYFHSNGNIYEGDYVFGERTGKGRYTWPNGNVYDGDWLNGRFHGKGRYFHSNGTVYDGDYVNGKRNGKGRYVFGEGKWKGDKYEGDFLDDRFHGKGRYTWTSGKVYEGDWLNDKINGYGIMCYPDGTVKNGFWENGVLKY